mmetsp:Transcript_42373/g.106817  ORF Transcript_42373/g.106817 Transcript_42373/m.106817 type:complete len:263 (+) Transcript_42373:27-815(+)
MQQPPCNGARGSSEEGGGVKDSSSPLADLAVELTEVRKSVTRASSPATHMQKHGLHGVCKGLPPGSGPLHQVTRQSRSLPVEVERALAGLDLGVELQGLSKHYAVEACVLALAEEGGGIRVLAKHGFELDLEQSNPDTVFGFKFFRHHLARDLPIIICDASKKQGLECHPLVVGVPRIAFYAAAPIIVRAAMYVGTLSIFDSSPRYDFTLQDCEVLEKLANKVAEIIGQSAEQAQASSGFMPPVGEARRVCATWEEPESGTP